MTGIEPGTSGTEQRTQNPSKAAPRGGAAGDQDLQKQEARDQEAESRRESGGMRMIDLEAERAGDDSAAGDASEKSDDAEAVCPLCGHPMGEHTIDRSSTNAVLNCPAPTKPAPQSFQPLNEVGMIKRSADGNDSN